MAQDDRKRDLVLAPNEFAYMQDVTSGQIKTFVGPCVINQTAQEVPVIYNEQDKHFRRCLSLDDAIRSVPVAVEGSYLVLLNPTVSGDQPPFACGGKPSPELKVGRRVNIPGPCMFGLWPGQEGKVVRGHHLRSNQYLLVRVYNEEEARRNWGRAVVKPASGDELSEAAIAVPPDLTVGRLIVIKGTEVSFYIPPTGVSVVPGDDGVYVREALTLERLEYCILVDEDGNKRYERGPQVVFPHPTEQFAEASGSIKFRAVELNEIQALHIKVIAPYTDERGIAHKEGDELFLTGKEVQIYYPREEHAIIRYDGNSKHFATAVPVGEGRYVMNRLTGEIETVHGPAMLLPDPRARVIVRRVLSEQECRMWYPGNSEAAEYNATLRQVVSQAPTTRRGVVSEGDLARHATKGRRGQEVNYLLSANVSAMEESRSTRDQRVVGEEMTRSATYTEPRSITLSTKFAGVPGIEVWPGYAVLVKNKTGARRVVVGPATIQLDYDETLEVMELSTGKPKTTDRLLQTVYLRYQHNLITDIVQNVETSDHFALDIKLQFRANFTGDQLRWFAGGNYVKLLCDHVRSMVKARVRGFALREFYQESENVLRDLILGQNTEGKRAGLMFEENGLHVYELEVLNVEIKDHEARSLLVGSQQQVMRDTLEVEANQRRMETALAVEDINRQIVTANAETAKIKVRLNDETAAEQHIVKVAEQQRASALSALRVELESIIRKHEHAMALSRLETEKAIFEQAKVKADDEAYRTLQTEERRTSFVIDRLKAISPELALALNNVTDAAERKALVDSFGGIAALKLKGILESAEEVFDFLPEGKMQIVNERAGRRAGRRGEATIDGGNGK